MDTQKTIEATIRTITNQKQEVASKNTNNNCNNDINKKTYSNSTTCPASPPSASSSPTHEFSFTISLNSSSTSTITTNTATKSLFPGYNKTKTANNNSSGNSNNNDINSFAIDLSPADDIFFHGHLLPLHFLSHLPVSPRSSTNSLDSFTLPITELLKDRKPEPDTNQDKNGETTKARTTTKTKSTYSKNNSKTNKPFSLFGWRKEQEQEQEEEEGEEEEEEEEEEMMMKKNRERQKKKLRFDQVSHAIKRYARMVLFFNKNRPKREKLNFHRGAYSFTGRWRSSNKNPNSMVMNRGGRRRGGDYSAPASMRASPTNSGLLVPNPTLCSSSTSDHSTMEELQAAIQAAIAHCKNSINNAPDKIGF